MSEAAGIAAVCREQSDSTLTQVPERTTAKGVCSMIERAEPLAGGLPPAGKATGGDASETASECASESASEGINDYLRSADPPLMVVDDESAQRQRALAERYEEALHRIRQLTQPRLASSRGAPQWKRPPVHVPAGGLPGEMPAGSEPSTPCSPSVAHPSPTASPQLRQCVDAGSSDAASSAGGWLDGLGTMKMLNSSLGLLLSFTARVDVSSGTAVGFFKVAPPGDQGRAIVDFLREGRERPQSDASGPS
jgi:hypothetical protein